MMKTKQLCLILSLPVLFLIVSCEFHENQVKSLQGQWKFSVGDNKAWADPALDDSEWERIYAPSKWEDEGFVGYNGFAWYRKHVRIPKKYSTDNLYLHMGRIDDADEVYFNGALIGSKGAFPPAFKGADDEYRRYFIPKKLINFNKDNVIAVRVYDQREGGGIRNGEIGIFYQDELMIDFDLSGQWKFHLYDSMQWKDGNLDESDWRNINVPGHYEHQGFENYDGFSWYRKKFDLPPALRDKKLVLVLGKIDDIDEVYINGVFAGGSGEFKITADSIMHAEDFYDEFRGYYIPDNVPLKESGNIIAVRVFDVKGNGGIYEGPIGFVDQENYSGYWQNIRKRKW